jgi:D-beta-D-heptose 7-phosphate kinase / D-beta-D-heptose 1-phosphate adenosyltransferase
MTRLVVVGDALLDRDLDGTAERLAPDAPVPVVDDPAEAVRPGGAALAAALAAADGTEVVLVTALAGDDAGRELRALLELAGVVVVDLGLEGPTPEKVRVRVGGQPVVRIDRAARPGRPGDLSDGARAAIAAADAVLVSDYGRGLAATASVRSALGSLPARLPVVWDPHPRGPEPVAGCRLVTPNRAEVERMAPEAGPSTTTTTAMAQLTARARALVARWDVASVVVTRGANGALLVSADGTPLAVPAPEVRRGDPCGAGDRFASAAATALAGGALTSEAVVAGVASASAFVAAGGAGGTSFGAVHGTAAEVVDVRPDAPLPGADEVVERVRRAGGTVVATGGCFDLLHAGHISLLQAARSLGDCLVVCLNSDASVSRLKGPGRPLQSEDDRAALLLALDCVDAVAVFDEATPVALLQRLRPDVFAKGADYAVADLPEATALAAWGGQAVVLPYLPGRSTTRLVDQLTGPDR